MDKIKKEKKVKEVRVLDMTPEQYERNKKIAIIGSIILGLLIIALFASLLSVYIIQKKEEGKDKNILKDNLTINTSILNEFKNKTPLDQISFSQKIKDEMLAQKPTEIVIFIHTQDLSSEIKNKITKLKFHKNETLFLTLNMELLTSKHSLEGTLQQLYKELKQESWDENKSFSNLDETPYLFKVDANNNYELIENAPITGEKISQELDKYLN